MYSSGLNNRQLLTSELEKSDSENKGYVSNSKKLIMSVFLMFNINIYSKMLWL